MNSDPAPPPAEDARGSMRTNTVNSSLRDAFAGYAVAWSEELSFRRQLLNLPVMIVVLVALRPAPVWCALLGFSVFLALGLELMNCAIEMLADLVHPEVHPAVKKLKDMACGGVILANLGTTFVGIFMFLDHFGVLTVS